MAKANYVLGNLNESAKFSLKARDISKELNDQALHINIQFFTIKILRQLGFSFLADTYVSDLKTDQYQNDADISVWLNAKLAQDAALSASKKGDFKSARENFNRAIPVLKSKKDTFSLNEINLELSRIYLSTHKTDSATYFAQLLLKDSIRKRPNSFQDLMAITQIANIYFSQNKFKDAKAAYLDAYNLSQIIPNIYYKNQSLQGLMTSYLALENKEEYSKYRVLQTLSALEVDTDRTLAMNSVYNFINDEEKAHSKEIIKKEYFRIYGFGFLLLLILVCGLLYNYYLNIKTAQYNAIWKYIKPIQTKIEIKETSKALEKSSIIPEEIELQLLKKLDKFENGIKFTQQEMSIALLAAKFDTNTKYLSEVINRQKGKNFNAYINELRINYIIEKLRTEKIYSQYKISYLAEECGFSSHSSFATVFKSITGLSPTAFIDLLKKQSN